MSDVMVKRKLICTVGLPRSGKSTWARKQGHPIVNPDSVRLAMHGQRFQALAEPFVWAVVHCMVKALFLAGHNVVILDATNTTKKRRDEWISKGWDTVFLVVGTLAHECIRRAKAEGDEVIIPVIERMYESYEALEGSEQETNGDKHR